MKKVVSSVTLAALVWLGQVCRAADALDSWTEIKFEHGFGQTTTNYFFDIAYGSGRFVVIGRDVAPGIGFIITSTDGTNWMKGDLALTNLFNGVTFGRDQFVAVGNNGRTARSMDGTHWSQSPSGSTNALTSITYGNGLFLAVGDGSILSSSDGSDWRETNLSRPFPPRVSYAGGQFFLIDDGSIFSSTNGTEWTHRFSADPGTSYTGITHGNGRFVAVSFDGNVAISPNGIDWTPFDIGRSNGMTDVTYGNGFFVAVGGLNQGIGIGAILLSSEDGTNWTAHRSGARSWLQGVAYGNGRFVATGFGTILVSPPVLSLKPSSMLANGTMPFRISGTVGLNCKIQVSSDLTNWQDLTDLVLTNENGQFSDHSATNLGQRFYRLVTP
jgi:hypothetical protein